MKRPFRDAFSPRPAPTPVVRGAGAPAPRPAPMVIVPVPPRGRRARRVRAGLLGLAALALIAGVVWLLLPPPANAPAAAAAPWQLELAPDGGRATPVLVVGRGTGIHLVSLRRAADGRPATSVQARVAEGDVWIVSLGLSPLVVSGNARGAGGVEGFGAQGRVIRVFQRPEGSGVRTSW